MDDVRLHLVNLLRLLVYVNVLEDLVPLMFRVEVQILCNCVPCEEKHVRNLNVIRAVMHGIAVLRVVMPVDFNGKTAVVSELKGVSNEVKVLHSEQGEIDSEKHQKEGVENQKSGIKNGSKRVEGKNLFNKNSKIIAEKKKEEKISRQLKLLLNTTN